MATRLGFCGIVWRGHSVQSVRSVRSVRSVSARPVRWLVLGACVSTAGRAFSARAADRDGSVKHVFVRCKSSGSIILSLYNVSEHPPTTPLLLYLPPSPQPHIKATEDFNGHVDAQPAEYTDDLASPPDYLLRQNIPIVSIRYRWEAKKETANRDGDAQTKVPPLSQVWPTPLHDVMFAYDWIQEQLAPPPPVEATKPGESRMQPRRDLYVYGAHLGATLAASLALTESHRDRPMAVRGVAAYNGIYNWTAFVEMAADGIPVADNAAAIQRIVPGTPSLSTLFATPADLFDAFSSSCLLFRTPGLVVPPIDFDEEVNRRLIEEAELEAEEMEDRAALDTDDGSVYLLKTSILMMGLSQKVYLAYPPAHTTLTIPQALLMHTMADGEVDAAAHHRSKHNKDNKDNKDNNKSKSKSRPRKLPAAVHGKNSYATQADEMTCLLRRGIDRHEWTRIKQREAERLEQLEYRTVDKDTEVESRSTESERRVQKVSIGAAPRNGSLELGKTGQKILVGWLNEHMKKAGNREERGP